MSSLAIRGGPAVTRDLGSAADMFVGPTAPRWRATSAARRTASSAPSDLDSATDMFVGLDPRGGPR
jgi:hypothetical protein